ncbi:expressed unknown protein [Seminavis robusta]|uniref:DUF6824 domain-containing protein n=1 Tax=Seminavis robusta TaxID=568900 RepID=A0A9N8DWZ9_9STRA|nr:expressed unknown protein [Seminavis robusta]|eukprot:Sro335_g120220.1 n/a (336) ;mRNA; r:68313-69320
MASKAKKQTGESRAGKPARPKKAQNGANVEVVEVPLRTDILCGKDKSCVSHEGSVNFRKTIDKYRERYCSEETSKQERMSITKEIVAKLSKSSRFLKYDTKDQVWKTITALAARDKVSHALRFANLKENRKLGKCNDDKSKPTRRRVSTSSESSAGSGPKAQSPEDAKFWNSLVSRQTKLLESIKKGEKEAIPAVVELPNILVTIPATESAEDEAKYDPLSIDDSSFEHNPTFQDYCLQLYPSEDSTVASTAVVEGTDGEDVGQYDDGDYLLPDDGKCTGDDNESARKCLYEDQSQSEDSPGIMAQSCGEEIASMISQPLMEWDLEHDGIFIEEV